MPIITKGPLTKGSPTTVTLSKTDLVAVSKVSSDAYFSDSSNWKKVMIFFESSVGNQSKMLTFNATQSVPTAILSTSGKARDSFVVKSVVIHDFDGGSLELTRSDITTAEFDFTFSAPVSSSFVTYESVIPGTTVVTLQGGVSAGGGDEQFAKSLDDGLTGDFSLEWDIDWSTLTNGNTLVGVASTTAMSGAWYLGLTCLETVVGSGNVRYWNNGSPVVNSSLSATSHVVKLTRVGTAFTFFIDGVQTQQFTGFSGAAYPTVRPWGQVACTATRTA
jgi:hypothetical protein